MDNSIVENILKERYYQPGESSWYDIALRVANYIGKDQVSIDTYYDVISKREIIPNSPCLMNAGTVHGGSLSACFSIPVEDSIDSIFDSVKACAKVHKQGGGCISGDSLILTDRGPIQMRELVESDISCKVLSYNEEGMTVSWAAVEHKHITPTEAGRVYDIQCSNNYKISASDWHPFFVFNGIDIVEKRADDLKPRDLIIGSGKLFQEDIKFNPDAWLAGFLISDGAFDTANEGTTLRLRVVKSYESVIKRAAEIIGCKYGISKDLRYEVDCYAFELYGKDAAPYFKFYGDNVRSLVSSEKFIPSHVYTQDASYQFSLLVGMLDGDGWYNKEKKQYIYDSASREVVYGLHAICGILGIPSRIRVRKPKKEYWSDMYSLTIENSHLLNELISEYSSRYTNVIGHKKNSVYVGMKFFNELNDKYGLRKTIYWRHGFQLPSGVSVNIQSWKLNGVLPKSVAAAVLMDLGYRNLAACVNSGYQVQEVTQRPTSDTLYDLTVRDSHTYLAGTSGFAVVHNTGISFSAIRSNGSPVKGTGHVASGPISFMKVFNEATETIKQGGKRRGANMGHLNVDHPDIIEFIKCKEIEGELSNFNISVNITDNFMKNITSPKNKEIFNLIVHGNWLNGEPGIIFIDTAERDNACPHLGKLTETNPCAETRLLPWESCNLASINLMECVNDGVFNWDKFEYLTRIGVNFLDDMIDKNQYPLPQIEEATKKTRKIGLGVMGFADVLLALGMTYGDEDSLNFADKLFGYMRMVANDESIEIAKLKGTYPASKGDTRRNAAVLSIAPTGSISLFAGVSSGIEPNFGWVYKRSTWVDGEKKTYNMLHPLFEEAIKDHVWKDSIVGRALDNGTVKHSGSTFSGMETFVVAKDIAPIDHIRMQAVIQKHVDQAISKTINCPSETTEEDIANMIVSAWKLGCKGLTIYREGSRNDVVLETNASKKHDELVKVVEIANPVKYKLVTGNGRILPKTPKDSPAGMYKRTSGCGHMMIAIGEMDSKPHSVTIVNKGGCDALTQALAELTALALRWQVPLWDVRKVLTGVKCSAALKNPKSDGKSCPDILGQILRDYYPHDDAPPKNDEVEKKVVVPTIQAKIVCPDCGGPLNFAEGCVSCPSCSYTKCS